jgi:hypothetical protein
MVLTHLKCKIGFFILTLFLKCFLVYMQLEKPWQKCFVSLVNAAGKHFKYDAKIFRFQSCEIRVLIYIINE